MTVCLCRSAQIVDFEVALNLDEKKTNGAPFDMWVEKGGQSSFTGPLQSSRNKIHFFSWEGAKSQTPPTLIYHKIEKASTFYANRILR